jgi:cation transport ATPase
MLIEKPESHRIPAAKPSNTELLPEDLGKAGERFQRSVFQVQGMDCASCTIKVIHAVSKLESTQSIEVDYFASRLALDHDPHRVDSATVANFVTRATGFKVIPQLEDVDRTSCRMSLPIKTEKQFSQNDTDKYTVVKEKHFHKVLFNPKTYPPRSVLDDLEPFGATLIPRDQADDHRMLARRAYHLSLLRSFACSVLVIPALVMTWGSPDLSFEIRHGIAFAAGSAIVLLSSSIWLGSIKSLVYLRHGDVQLLVSVSTITAYIFSVVAFSLGIAGINFEEPFFETPALLLTLVHVGGTVQAYARRTVMQAAASMQTMQPGEALLLVDEQTTSGIDHDRCQLVDTRLLGYGDVIQVDTNGVIAADGILIDNEGTIDESCMTGESVPVTKGVGSLVVAGCVNVGAPLHIHVSRLVHENSAAKMADLVNQAHQTRLPVQDAADRIAAVILPCTLAVAAISFLAWSLVSRFVRNETSTDAGILGLTYAIAVVAVACPCALVLVVSNRIFIFLKLPIFIPFISIVPYGHCHGR